jgi:glycosyltransferase involved in cell wall biosynthesis
LKILLGSHFFSPSTGGIETVTALLASEFVARGHEVRVITQSAGTDSFPFEVVRQPSMSRLLGLVKWCDVFLQNNISLRTLWPLLFIKRPLFITHQTWLGRPGESLSTVDRFKRQVSRFATNLVISQAVGDGLGQPAITIGNPFDDQVFRNIPEGTTDKDVVFVGRLVSDKGADVLIDALALLRAKGTDVSATIVGDGPEREALERRARETALTPSIAFSGSKTDEDLARILNSHRLLVIPSRWPEPFGIVALEGIACGCAVIGSSGGGLPEAIGPCGRTVPNGDSPALAGAIEELLANATEREHFREAAADHLEKFRRATVAEKYLRVMEAKA